VGVFMVAGFLCFAYLSIRLGGLDVFGSDTYRVEARFGSVSGLKPGAVVEVAGVKVGEVADIELAAGGYEAQVALDIRTGVTIQEDSIASVRTAGIIGDRFVNITPGGSDELIGPGGAIRETEPAINLEELVSKYIFGQ
jgi:phospholipid/cholesterol/gamma-HCH transport system substrate-binding protein